MGDEPIREWQLIMLSMALEYRGLDATGFALMDDKGEIHWTKHHEPAWRFTKSDDFRNWCDAHLSENTRIALVHTRKFTKGNPMRNENNHPLIAGDGLIIHNGSISNDDDLFEANKGAKGFTRSCETDSDVIRAILDFHGGIDRELIHEMSKLRGTAAIAAIHPNSPGKLLLLRDSNPLILGATEKMLMFASDKTALHRALKPWVKVHNIPMQVHAPDISFFPFPNETGWIIGPKGFELNEKFTCNGFNKVGNTRYYATTDYLDKKERLRTEAAAAPKAPTVINPTNRGSLPVAKTATANTSKLPHWVVCPGIRCNKHLMLSEEDREIVSLAYLACGDCGTNLGGAVPADLTN